MQRKAYSLDESFDYINASNEEKSKIINKCGPDGFINYLVPDHILGLNVESACNVHDWDYSQAKDHKDLEKADKRFQKNLKKIITNETKNPILRFLRKGIAKIYYWAVRLYSQTRDFD